MEKYDEILKGISASIDSLHSKFTKEISSINYRIDSINEFLERDTKRFERLQEKQAKQGQQIAQLNEKVDELIKSGSGVIWKSGDLNSVGIDKETARSAFHEIGLNQRQALTLLDAAGRLRVDTERDGSIHRTKKVRVSPTQVTRCVVVII